MAIDRMEVERNKPVMLGTVVDLKPLLMKNIYKHYAWSNDPELHRLDSEIPYEEEPFGEFKKRFERMIYHPSPRYQYFEIHTKQEQLIGVVTLSNINTDCRHCTIDITICDRDFWGCGYGVDTMQLVLDYCFNRLGMHRVGAETFDYNDAWQRLVEGSGFKREGTARDYLYLDGQYWDKQGYALLETEYSARFAQAS